MANNKGFNYYSVETNRYQDIRLKKLKRGCGATGIAVYDFILCEIYRVKGCYTEWDESHVFEVADYFSINESQVKEIVNYCCAVGLFDKALFTRGNILSSAAIQSRFLDWSEKAKRKDVILPEVCKILPEETPKVMEEIPENSGSSEQSKEKELKGTEPKKKKGKETARVTLALPFDSKEFLEKWETLKKQPTWKKKTDDALRENLDFLATHPEDEAIAIMKKSIAGGWMGLFELKDHEKGKVIGMQNGGLNFPNYWSRKYESSLSPADVPKFWAHLRGLGLKPKKNAVGETMDWIPKEQVA